MSAEYKKNILGPDDTRVAEAAEMTDVAAADASGDDTKSSGTRIDDVRADGEKSDEASDVILSVKDLHVYFYTNQRCNKVLRGISFDIRKGRTLCIVGESGCGKSVTANSILRLLPELSRIESGSITYYKDGTAIRLDELEKNGKQMRTLRGEDIAIIFQDPMTALNPVFTVGYQIEEMLREHKKGLTSQQYKQEAIEDMADMGIPAPELRYSEYPHQFSGGMRQRSMIAMGMSCQPRILLADEPTTALDVTISAQIFELMNELKEKHGTAIVMITHNMGVVAEMADEVAVMYMGNIVEYGPVEEIFTQPTHPYTKALLASIPVLGKGKDQNLEPIRGSTPDPFDRPKGCQFCPRCDYATSRCEDEMPDEMWVSDYHYTRCFNYKEVTA